MFRRCVTAALAVPLKPVVRHSSSKVLCALTSNGSTVAVWHPEPEFPYEFSRPIPKQMKKDDGSLMKESVVSGASGVFKSKNPEVARQELMDLTYTTKHRWFPRARDKKAKKTPMDRKYL